MTEPAKPVLLGESMVSRALSDDTFFNVLPEYLSLKVKMQTMKSDLTVKTSGCSSCRRNKVVRSLYSDFLTITLALGADAITRLKQYFGAPGLLVNSVDKTTSRLQLKVL